jgi:hypothetical protein
VAAARFGRWLVRGISLSLLAGLLFLGVRYWQASQPVVWTLAEVPSPDYQVIAALKSESGWGYAKDFVTLRRAGERDQYERMVVINYEQRASLLLRWRGNRDLDVGVPAWSTPEIRATEKDGVQLNIVPYPNQAVVHDKFERLAQLYPFRRGEMIEFQRSRILVDELERAATYRGQVRPVGYNVERRVPDSDSRFCSLQAVADGGHIAREIGLSLQAKVDNKAVYSKKLADFALVLYLRGIEDRDLSRLTATGAQLIGSDFATSMAESGSRKLDDRPDTGSSYTIPLLRQRDLDGVLGVLSEAPYKLAFLWDLPDTVAVFEVETAPAQQDIASFRECVGDAVPRDAFFSSRAGVSRSRFATPRQ